MAVSSSSKKRGGDGDGGAPATAAKRRKHTEVRMVGGRIYDPENGKTCHQCRQKTMDFVAECKNLKKDKLCTLKFCHKCLFNRYGEKAEDMALVDDWNCPACRGICNCSFCMKKRGHHPTGILIHTARATGFSSVSELLHVNGSENVGVAKILQGIDMRPAKHTPSGNDRVALSPLKQDENILSEKQQKTKHGKSKKSLDSKKGDVDKEDVALLMEVNARMTRSGGKLKKTQGKTQDKKVSSKEENPDKPKVAKESLKDTQHDQEINKLPSKQAGKKEVKASKKVGAQKREKKVEKMVPNALQPQKIECESEKQKVITPLKKLDKPNIQKVVKFTKQQKDNVELQKKDAIAEIELPKGTELATVAGVELRPEDVGHALQFLEFCSAFGKILNLKKGEPEHVLRELITGGRARRGKISVVVQFHIQLASLLQEELGESSSLGDSSNGKPSWLQVIKDCVSEISLDKLKMDQFEKGSNDYDSFNSTEKLTLLNFICDELLCTEKLRSWIAEQSDKCSEKVKEAKERVQTAKQKEKQLKQKIQDDLVKAIISKNGATLSISEHDAIVSKIKSEAALATAELLEAKGVVPDEKFRSEAVRTQPILYDADGHVYWRLRGQSEPNILLQDVGTWESDGSSEKWFAYTAEQEKVINEYISGLRQRSLSSQVTRRQRKACKAPQIE